MSAMPLTADDRWAITELFARYARCFDTADVDGFLGTFLPNAVYILSGGRRYVGHDEIRGYLTATTAREQMIGRQHHADQLLFDGDGERCTVRSYATGTKYEPDGSCSLVFVGHYRDVLVKVDGRWFFETREFANWEGDAVRKPSTRR